LAYKIDSEYNQHVNSINRTMRNNPASHTHKHYAT